MQGHTLGVLATVRNMKRLPLAALVAAFFIFLLFSVSVRQAVLLVVGHLQEITQD